MIQKQSVNIQTFLNEHPFSGFQWVIFGLCFLIVLADGFDTAAIGFIAPSLINEWGVTRPDLGPVLSAAQLPHCAKTYQRVGWAVFQNATYMYLATGLDWP